MKKDRIKKIEEKNEDVDLSVIKESDLDDTATFTDLLSRKERKKHKKDKDTTMEIEPITDNNEDNVEFETEDLAKQISENKTVEIKEEEIKEIINTKLEDEQPEEIKEEQLKEFKNYFNVVLFTLFIIFGIGALIYGIVYTDFFSKDLYLLVNGGLIILFVFNYCIMTIASKKTAIFFTIINYLIFIAAIAFNVLIYFKII